MDWRPNVRPKELAEELGVTPKTVRDWLRKRHMHKDHEPYDRWELTVAQERYVRQCHATRRQRADSRDGMITTTVTLPSRVHAHLLKVAKEESTVMTEIVRRAVGEWLAKRR